MQISLVGAFSVGDKDITCENNLCGRVFSFDDTFSEDQIISSLCKQLSDETGVLITGVSWHPAGFVIDPVAEQGLGIIADIRYDGIPEWTDSSAYDEDDWVQMDAFRVEHDFVSSAIFSITDLNSQRILVEVLVKSAVNTFDLFLAEWNEEQLSEVKSLTEGLATARIWLAERENERG